MGIKYRKREKTPCYREKQLKKAKKLSLSLLQLIRHRGSKVILNDEKYFSFSAHQMPGNAGFYAKDKQECPENVRFVQTTKYPPKVLMWIAISERGLSQPFFRHQNSPAINADV